ncbi:MAG: NAD-dependent epimerase/dehydratase family protein [Methylobacteriaceae bacterium]|jgi:UDP-glucose 4-epimerase|nr:NAD-dependent epimerase/dehydratase family protein [Methylobacteriaceae bacterium]
MDSHPVAAITGASGFIGGFLIRLLAENGYAVRALGRSISETVPAPQACIGDLADPHNLDDALAGVDYVIHAAGLAHSTQMRDDEPYQAVNFRGTVALARAARRNGVRRFIHLSSVRALCGPTAKGIVTDDTPHAPTDAYGRSKRDAELFLMEGGADGPDDWAVLRPVLTYGPGVKGNMARLLRLARSPLPLPFGRLSGKRSLVSLHNLGGGVLHLLRLPGAVNRAFLVADDTPVTVPEIITALRGGLGRSPGLIGIPESFLTAGCAALGKGEAFARLSGNLMVDTSALKSTGWAPMHDAPAGLAELPRQVLRRPG